VKTTGYPPEMLEVNLDLEADLGVDSVQRAEIWVSLTTEHGLDPSVRPTGARTIAQLAESLAGMGGTPATAGTIGRETSTAPAVYTDSDVRLFASVAAPFDRSAAAPFACRRVLAIAAEDDAAAAQLKKRLGERGVEVDVARASGVARMSVIEVAGAIDACDTIVYLAHAGAIEAPFDGRSLRGALAKEVATLYQTARALVPALEKKPRRVIFPVAMDGAFGTTPALARPLGAFPAGFVRCLARELPQCAVQLVDGGEHGILDAVEASIDFVPGQLEWGMTGSGAAVPRTSALAPAGTLLAPLSRGDLVLVTGGARGVVFECVMELARRTGCRLLLTGRTELPMGRPEWLRTPPERIDGVIRDMEIRLVKDEGKKLQEAKRIGAKARSQWELSRNLDAMEAAGVEGRYERCDVTDAKAFSALLAQLADAKEIVRGVVHGAGIQKSKLVTELADDAINATVATKLDPIFTMLDALDWSKVKLLSAFGSIAGLFGNAGQSDYGLANDLLAWLVAEIGARHPHVKAQTVEWTAWVGTGMVSEEEAKRFAQVGLQPLDVRTGVRLYAEATLGAAHQRVAAFNASAPFTSVRPIAEFPLAARPQERLLFDGPVGGPPLAVFSERHHPYIRQHLVRLEPVVPGTFVVELLAEATEGSGRTPTAIQFRRPLGVRAGEVAVEVVEDGDSAYVVPKDRPALAGRALANLAFASCRLEAGGAPPADDFKVSKKDVAALLEEGAAGGAGFYRLLDSKFSGALKTGPAFRGIRATAEKDGLFLASAWLTDDAMASIAVPGRFVFNPVLADMAVQAAAAWAMIRFDRMEIPFEIGALHVLGPTRDRRSIVVCRAHEMDAERTVVDLVVREPDGRPILAMDRLVLRTIEAAGG
jgi:NAD(P)-dependent dehydrogenase (short-subunit alcohol dehydrogenase family)